VKSLFDMDARRVNDKIADRVPAGIDSILDQRYGPGADEHLDVYFPDSAGPLPTVIWIHGGGWLSGDKSQITNYLKIIAGKGYAVVGINYSLAPGSTYPTPLIQANRALGYLAERAADLHIDPTRLVLAGDSAGSHIAAQLGVITTNPSYAELVGIGPTLHPAQLAGIILHCGVYNMKVIDPDEMGLVGGLVRTFAWSYSGVRDFQREYPRIAELSVVDYVTSDFPPTFISGGNGDPLTPQSIEMAARLTGLGVPVESHFFPDDLRPALGHEYQFDLTNVDGQRAFDLTTRFLRQRTTPS
jgi:acetyl esterase/lipase